MAEAVSIDFPEFQFQLWLKLANRGNLVNITFEREARTGLSASLISSPPAPVLCCAAMMNRPDVLEVHDPEVARLFHEEAGAYYILQFAARPMTVEGAATNLKISASAMRRWLGRFMNYGLVQCIGVDKNRRYLYQLVARKLVIHDDHPTLVTPEDYMQPIKARLDGFIQSTTKEYNIRLEADPWVLVIQASGDEWAETVPIPRSQYTGSGQDAHALAFRNDWFDVVLTPQQAKLFAAEMLSLKQRMAEASDKDSGQATYLVHLGFVKNHM